MESKSRKTYTMSGNRLTLNPNLDIISQTLRAIAHPNRVLILYYLSRTKRMSVGAICEATGFAQPLVSHHLLDMHSKGVLSLEREGRNAYYKISDSRVLKILRVAETIKPETMVN